MNLSSRTQGYFFILITMSIWGGFTILSRLSARWHLVAWGLTALRFGLAFCILMPILMYRKETAFLCKKEPIILALVGGIAYCLCAYSAFMYAPAAHAAIFLNGAIPFCTALAAYFIVRQSFDRHMWLSLVIMLSSVMVMVYLLGEQSKTPFGIGDVLFLLAAICWGVFTVLLKQSSLTAWQAMCSVAIWSAVIYIPIYALFLPKAIHEVRPEHVVVQTLFHGVLVVIIATLTYVEAIKRLGAFKAGSIVTLAPFIAAILAIPLLGEPMSMAIVCGLMGMSIGALQPWHWFLRS